MTRQVIEQYSHYATTVTLTTFDGKIRFPEIGDVAPEFLADCQTIPQDVGVVDTVLLSGCRIGKILRMSEELVYDERVDFEIILLKEIAQQFGGTEENGFINGDGDITPNGLLDDVRGTEIGVTGKGDTITFDDVAALYFSVKPEYRRSGVFVMSDETAFALRSLKDGSGMPLWNINDNIIFGHTVETSQYMPRATAGVKPILFGDLSRYFIFERGGFVLQTIKEMYASVGQIGYNVSEKLDGLLLKRDAVKVLQMSAE